MTFDQALAFGLVGLTVAGFVWGRLPYDLIALAGLLAGVVTGIVPVKAAFSGFSDDVVVIVVAALLVSAAIARSGVVEDIMRPLMPFMKTPQRQVMVLVGAVTLLAMFTKNVGALAMFMPVAAQVSRKSGTSISQLLMPMAFGSLIGGLVTLVGTSPNIIVSKIRQDMTGQPFTMFDYAPVGLGVVAVGFLFLCLASNLIPKRKPGGAMGEAFALDAYTAEARVPEGSSFAGRTVADLEAAADGDIAVRTVIRERFRRLEPTPALLIREEDDLLLDHVRGARRQPRASPRGQISYVVSARASSIVPLVRRSSDSSSQLRSFQSRLGSWWPMSVCATPQRPAISMMSSRQLWPHPTREIGPLPPMPFMPSYSTRRYCPSR